MPRLDFSLTRVLDEDCRAVDGGHELALTAYLAQVDGDRLVEFAAVARVSEVFAGWDPQDYQRANLKLHRALAARVAELAVAARREEG
ncbi:hypothetical protein B2G69_07830 [Methylorubrum zatmanii]|nr:hypothetical protein [Methylorubrum zatmanii]ARO54062.1 hypothetical protein B2G69_07830 [Methylorubrum zatmanii]